MLFLRNLLRLTIHVSRSICELPCQRQDVPSYRVQNFRIDRIGGIGGLMKVWVNAAADDGDGWDTCFFERHVIAAGEKSVQVELVRQTSCLSCLLCRGFFKPCDTNG